MKHHLLVRERTWYRLVTVLTLVAFSSACRTWSTVPLTQIEAAKVVEPKAAIRVHTKTGETVTMDVESFDFPNVTGREWGTQAGIDTEHPAEVTTTRGGGTRTVDLREVDQLEVSTISGWRTFFLALGVVVVIAGIVSLIIALTKTSCPFVYVDTGNGLQFVGEAYSGATSRAVQREDLMPLPPLGSSATVVLSNEAQESQFTDQADLVIVDHGPGRRAVSTHEAGLLLLGEATSPLSATDLEGRDVVDLVREVDGRPWVTDLSAAARRPDPPLREGVVVSFRAPPGGGPLALELDAGNTPWLDLVVGRFYALFGDRIEGYLDASDRPEAREPVLAWREREGVDLRVEVESAAGKWERVAVVPTTGPASPRHLAVPLPSVGGESIRVRLSSGVGFWLLDRVALAKVESQEVPSLRIAPRRAIQADGTDARALLSATDGRYQVLPRRGTLVRLEFELQPRSPGLTREAFLHTSGYYRVNRPPQSELSSDTLYRLRDEPGSLSRFSLDLYRHYEEAATKGRVTAPQ